MRCRGIVQRFYQTKKRFVWHIRHIGYWKRRDCSHPTYFQKQYVYSDKKNKRIAYVARSFKVKLACLGFRLVQKRKWEVRLQRIWVLIYNVSVWCGNQGTNKSNNPSIFRRGMCSCRQSARNLLFNCQQLPMPRDIPLLRLLGFSFCDQTSVKCCTL